MGIVLSRFRKKLSTRDVLEEIEKKLKDIDEFQQETHERQKRVARRLIVICVVISLFSIMAFFLSTSIQKHKLYFIMGVTLFGVLSWLLYKGLKWYYQRQMISNSEKSVELRKKKKKILEEVMDTETYKVAKELLDKFGEKQPEPQETRVLSPTVINRSIAPGSELRQRHIIPAQGRNSAPRQPPATPANIGNTMRVSQQQTLSTQRPVAMNYGQAPMRPLPRPILPRERGVFDRVMDFFVGDGPHQRYALICRHCGGHNGMALQEEFEFVGYYCCYCRQFNPPRKMRPTGPRLPVPPPPVSPPPPTSKVTEEEKKESTQTKEEKPAESGRGSSCDEGAETSNPSDEENETKDSTASSEVIEKIENMEVDTQEEKVSEDVGSEPEPNSLR